MNFGSSLLNLFFRPSLCRNVSTSVGPLLTRLTPALYAEPLKKKRKLDPNLSKAKLEKRRKRIEKQIRRLEKNEGQLKPIDENEVSLKLRNELKLRERKVQLISEDERDSRWEIEMKFSQHRFIQRKAENKIIHDALTAQERALKELKLVSDELWLEAVQADQFVLPFRREGPVLSLPIADYIPPDGDFIDVTRKWD